MAKGLTNREIAGVLSISAHTVKTHVAKVLDALEVSNRAEAAGALHEMGLVSRDGADPQHHVAGFGERPAIAVLPFDNFSDDPTQEFLADGIVEDLVTRLATWRWFPVISRSSTFAYKGRPIDVKAVSRELGARYLVEGSVRRGADQVRITVQLIDGATGHHVLAERYDRSLGDVFALEDEIVDQLVMTLEPALAKIGGVHVETQRVADLGVWECLQRGFLHLVRFERSSIRQAKELFELATEQGPEVSLGYTGAAFAHVSELIFQIADDREESIKRILELSRRAIALDPNEAIARFTLGLGHLYDGDPDASHDEHTRALELNPSVAWGHGGLGIAFCAMSPPQPDDAVAALETAIRLSPRDPFLPYILVMLGQARLLQGRLADATECVLRSRDLAPELPVSYGALAFQYAISGRMDEAREVLAHLSAAHPGFSPIEQARGWVPPGHLPLLRDTLSAAGWEEPETR
jgi:adenylate cyclase